MHIKITLDCTIDTSEALDRWKKGPLKNHYGLLFRSLQSWAYEYHCKGGSLRMPDDDHAVITFEKSTHATWFLMTNNLPTMFLAEKIS